MYAPRRFPGEASRPISGLTTFRFTGHRVQPRRVDNIRRERRLLRDRDHSTRVGSDPHVADPGKRATIEIAKEINVRYGERVTSIAPSNQVKRLLIDHEFDLQISFFDHGLKFQACQYWNPVPVDQLFLLVNPQQGKPFDTFAVYITP